MMAVVAKDMGVAAPGFAEGMAPFGEQQLHRSMHDVGAYVLEVTAKPMLAYEDYHYIERWLRSCYVDMDRLLLVVEDVLVERYEKTGKYPQSLQAIDGSVMRRLYML